MRSMVEGALRLATRPAPLPPPGFAGRSLFPASRGRISAHRKSLRMILPTLLLGNESTNTITFGTL
jgi:hypothetical protein